MLRINLINLGMTLGDEKDQKADEAQEKAAASSKGHQRQDSYNPGQVTCMLICFMKDLNGIEV